MYKKSACRVISAVVFCLLAISCKDSTDIPNLDEPLSGKVVEVRRLINEMEHQYLSFYYKNNDLVERVSKYQGSRGDYSLDFTYDQSNVLQSIVSSCDFVCTNITFQKKDNRIVKSVKTINSTISNNLKFISHYEYNLEDQIIGQIDTVIETFNAIPPYDTTVVHLQYEYDAKGNLTKTIETSENGGISVTQFEYDDNPNPLFGNYVDLLGRFSLLAKSNPNNQLNDCTYEYSGDYPVKIICQNSSYSVVYQ